jgi:hypothetical protein
VSRLRVTDEVFSKSARTPFSHEIPSSHRQKSVRYSTIFDPVWCFFFSLLLFRKKHDKIFKIMLGKIQGKGMGIP